jgi:5,6-dimethylbenzimidazole synthase
MIEAAFGEGFRASLLDLLVWRRDVRRFKREALAEGTFERLVEIACLSPSVGLSQPWRFVVVESAERRAVIRASFERCNRQALLLQ